MLEIKGSKALFRKEIIRFFKVYNQTLLAPVVTSLIYLAIFNLAMGAHKDKVNNVEYSLFISAGIIIMSSMQNSFANSSSTIMMAKLTGTIIDYIIPPFTPNGLVIAFTLSSAIRGIIVAILVTIALSFFIDINIYNLSYSIYYVFISSIILALMGILTSIVSETFDQMASINTYIITPLSFLSGTFYSIKNLPKSIESINNFNPFFYIIDGFRYSITGFHDACLFRGFTVISVTAILLYIIAYKIIKKGYKIKN